jgi:hypothetical protein
MEVTSEGSLVARSSAIATGSRCRTGRGAQGRTIARNALRYIALSGILVLSNCAGSELQRGWTHRYGPAVALSEEDVASSVLRQISIMEQLALAADTTKTGTTDYYQVTLAGFNFIDEQCDAFLRELYMIDVERNRLKRGIDGAQLLTGAVLSASPASKATMEIVAQAFGFAGLLTDTYANSYLMNTRPSTILSVVSKLQNAYQDQTEKDKSRINSRPAAYAQIRGYLRLCMPVTIESQINERVVTSKAVSGNDATREATKGPGTTKSVRLAD